MRPSGAKPASEARSHAGRCAGAKTGAAGSRSVGIMQITADTHVADLASSFPGTIRVFQQYGLDFCCGGKRPLSEVCAEQSVNVDRLIGALEQSLLAPVNDTDWQRERLSDLVSHIQQRFHVPLREELARLGAMMAKVIARHGDAHGDMLRPLGRVFADFQSDLMAHMQKEDGVLFPAVIGLERGDASVMGSWHWIAGPIGMMELEHADAGAALAEMRRLTNGFVPPADACPTFQGLLHGLGELEREMHLHVHLENNILFPRAAALADR